MKVKRIVTNILTQDPSRAKVFYEDILGLEILMDHGWIQTYGSDQKALAQVSFATEGGSRNPLPGISIEIDDLDEALKRFEEAGIPIEYGPVNESWGVRRFFVKDPFGKLINIVSHETGS